MRTEENNTQLPQLSASVSVISRKDEVGSENECHTCKSWLWGECRCKHQH